MNPAVGQIAVTAQYEVDIGGLGSRRVLLGEPALLVVRDNRALRVTVDHPMFVGVLGHRVRQIGDPGLDRPIICEVEQPREFPQRLVRPRRATGPAQARGSQHEAAEA